MCPDHMASQWWSWDVNMSRQVTGPVLRATNRAYILSPALEWGIFKVRNGHLLTSESAVPRPQPRVS